MQLFQTRLPRFLPSVTASSSKTFMIKPKTQNKLKDGTDNSRAANQRAIKEHDPGGVEAP
ncbi:MAG: hypothetical protein ACC707_12235 [Thiohalomonadales bacterium]